MEILVENFLGNFNCISSKCSLSCCQTWTISIDKQTFENYKTVDSNLLKPIFEKHLVMFDNPTESNYGYIKFLENGKCPFLDSQALCLMQLEKGLNYLCAKCYSFPRTFNRVNNNVEVTLSLSCPEAARICLLDDTQSSMIEANMPLGDIVFNKKFNSKAYPENSPLDFVDEIRKIGISILQNRNFEIHERILLLGALVEYIQKLDLENECFKIPALCESYIYYLNNDSKPEILEILEPHTKFRLELFKILANNRLNLKNKEQLFTFAYFDKIKNFLDSKNIEDFVEEYNSLYPEIQQNLFKPYNYIFENYLVNLTNRNIFPLGANNSITKTYLHIIVNYFMLENLIIFNYHHENDKTFFELIDLVSRYTRDFEHDAKFIDDSVSYLIKNNLTSLQHISYLVNTHKNCCTSS